METMRAGQKKNTGEAGEERGDFRHCAYGRDIGGEETEERWYYTALRASGRDRAGRKLRSNLGPVDLKGGRNDPGKRKDVGIHSAAGRGRKGMESQKTGTSQGN